MPLDTQAYLLRILESGEFLRVGSSKVLKTDVRVIAATNIDLMERVKAGRFREDLYYRLSTVPIQVPALRYRREDIYMLFRKFSVDFAERYKTTPIALSDDARFLLEQYSWPGNIRELKNVAEQISVLSESRDIDDGQLESFIPNVRKRHLPVIAKNGSGAEGLQEREILYKLLFDMKSDLNDLKRLVFELIQNNDLSIPDQQLKQLAAGQKSTDEPPLFFEPDSAKVSSDLSAPIHTLSEANLGKPIILAQHGQPTYDQVEEVDENLSIEDMEKDLIKKALKKHKGRRKDAAVDLGISERTLYRKIKQYELP
jgi:DNA-binding NtrC family response regulator